MDDNRIARLIKQLKKRNVNDRTFAARDLGEIGDKSAVPALIEALKDEFEGVRIEATEALRKIGKPAALMLIETIETSGDEDWAMRRIASEALAEIGGPAVPVLIEALKNENPNGIVGAWNAFILMIGKSTTIEELETIEKAIIERSKVLRKGPYTGVRAIKARAEIVMFLKDVAERKNELVPKRDLLLPDSIKPSKRGKVYSSMRKMRTL